MVFIRALGFVPTVVLLHYDLFYRKVFTIFVGYFKLIDMAKRHEIDLGKIEAHYRIDRDGRIWSFKKNRYLKQFANSCGYSIIYLSLAMKGTVGVHRLIAAKYVGSCPVGMEVNHKDGDRGNNHWTNLEYVTHSDNMKKSFSENGRVAYWKGKKRGALPDETKKKMAERKFKAIVADTGETWESMQACSDALGTYRKAIYNAIRYGRRLKCGLLLKFVD